MRLTKDDSHFMTVLTTGLMPISEIPNPLSTGSDRPPRRPLNDEERAEFIPVLLQQAHDELARSRLREAFWISIILHFIFIASIAFGPKYFPGMRPVQVATAEDLLRDKELTYLQLPADEQKVTQKPDSKFISDKNRIATSRNPTIDRKTLEELRDSAMNKRPGPPNPPGSQSAAQSPQQQQQAQGAPDQGSAQPSPMQPAPNSSSDTLAQNATPAGKLNPFGGARTAGSIIAEAARNSQRSGYSGAGGEGGQGPIAGSGIKSNMDVLSDTQGVDFGSYLSRVLQSVRVNWYQLVPEVARPPIMKKGKVSIEFVILKDGRVAGMRVVGPSGDVALDRAAWGGISGSNPFSPLPGEFRGPYLALRFHFYYNPDKGDLE